MQNHPGVQTLRQERDILRAEIEPLREQLETMKEDFDPMAAELEQLRAEVEPLRQERDRLQGEVGTLRDDCARLKAELGRLQGMVDRGELVAATDPGTVEASNESDDDRPPAAEGDKGQLPLAEQPAEGVSPPASGTAKRKKPKAKADTKVAQTPTDSEGDGAQ